MVQEPSSSVALDWYLSELGSVQPRMGTHEPSLNVADASKFALDCLVQPPISHAWQVPLEESQGTLAELSKLTARESEQPIRGLVHDPSLKVAWGLYSAAFVSVHPLKRQSRSGSEDPGRATAVALES